MGPLRSNSGPEEMYARPTGWSSRAPADCWLEMSCACGLISRAAAAKGSISAPVGPQDVRFACSTGTTLLGTTDSDLHQCTIVESHRETHAH